MDADRVDLRELIAMLSDIGHRLRGPHDAPVGLVQARFQAQPRRDL
jgi:hypothetical protein